MRSPSTKLQAQKLELAQYELFSLIKCKGPQLLGGSTADSTDYNKVLPAKRQKPRNKLQGFI